MFEKEIYEENDPDYVETDDPEFKILSKKSKGQLILKCPLGVLESPEKPTKVFSGFLP